MHCFLFLSFPPLFAEWYLLQAGEDASRVPGQTLGNCPGGGEGAGFITGKDSPGVFPGGLPTRLSEEGKKERWGKDNHSTLFIFYVPTTSFRFSEAKLQICILLSLLKPIPFLLMSPGGAHRSVWKIIHILRIKPAPDSVPRSEGTADRGSGFTPRLFLGIRECLEWIQRLSCLPTACGRRWGPSV